MDPVKGARPETRRERATRTRGRVLDAAYRLFCAKGWEETTMQAVADEAGVAVQTVYFTFGTKAKLLSAVERRAILGDTPRSVFFEQWGARIANETDPRKLIGLFVETDAEIKSRLAPLIARVGESLPDPDAPNQPESGRDHFFGSLVGRIHELGALRPGLSAERALDIVRVINVPSAFGDLTVRRGWTKADWIDWLTDLLTHQLVDGS